MSPFLWIRFHIKLVIKFIFPNLRKIIRKKVTYVDYPVCNQKLLITGEGSVQFGANCKFGYKLGGNYSRGLIELQSRYSQSKIIFGNHVTTNNNLVICAANLVEIGDDTLIGQGVSIMDHEAHCIDPAKRRQLGKIGKVIIGRNVWIGNNVIILKNSEIGLNSIVAAGAVVAGKFPSNVIIGGVPSKVIKEL
jgi:acetyltransferase-like isoleucine patch superfamily enzyme